MKDTSDFIIEDGALIKYVGNDVHVVVPNHVTSIEYKAFDAFTWKSNVKNIESIALPDGLITIKHNAFSDCVGLKKIEIPNSVQNIGEEAFRGCVGLQDANGFVIVNNILFDCFSTAEEISLPKGISAISQCAFRNCENLKCIRVPDGVKRIGSLSFNKGLKCIELPESIEEIDKGAFYGCGNIDTVIASMRVKDLLWNALENKGSFAFNYFCVADEDEYPAGMMAYLKNNKKQLLTHIVNADSVVGINKFLSLSKRYTIRALDEYIEACSGNQRLAGVIEEFKSKTFSSEAQKKTSPTYQTIEYILPNLQELNGKNVFIAPGCSTEFEELDYIFYLYGSSVEKKLSKAIDYIVVPSARMHTKKDQKLITEAAELQSKNKGVFVVASELIRQHQENMHRTFDDESLEERVARALKLFDSNVKHIELRMDRAKTYHSVPLAAGHVKGLRRKNCDIAGAEMFISKLKQHIREKGVGYDCYYANLDRDLKELLGELKQAYVKMLPQPDVSTVEFYFRGTAWLRVAVGLIVICNVFLCENCDSDVIFYRDKWDYRGEHQHSKHIALLLNDKYTEGYAYQTGY